MGNNYRYTGNMKVILVALLAVISLSVSTEGYFATDEMKGHVKDLQKQFEELYKKVCKYVERGVDRYLNQQNDGLGDHVTKATTLMIERLTKRVEQFSEYIDRKSRDYKNFI